MSRLASKRKPRTSAGPKPTGEWRKKVHPFFLRLMENYRRINQLCKSASPEDRAKGYFEANNPPEDFVRQAREVGEEFRRAGRPPRGIAGKLLDLDLSDDLISEQPSEERYMLAWLSWFKFGKTWKQLLHERAAGSWKASQRAQAVIRDFEKWKFGRLDPNAMRFKMDREHFNVMAFGLEFGLDRLTQEELADFFDSVCPCGAEQHDPENMRKLRGRILKALERLDAKTTALRSQES